MIKKKIEMEVNVHISIDELIQEIRQLGPLDHLLIIKQLVELLDEEKLEGLKNFFTYETGNKNFIKLVTAFASETRRLFSREGR